MTLTVTEYRHDDASAPTLDGSVGSLITVLQACLVDGYGDKGPAGWTKPLSATGRAAFVNSTTDGGTGCYVYVDDNAPSAEGARSASIRTYTTMTDIDTGDYGTDPAWCRKSKTVDSTARPWILWADGLTFWLYVVDSGDDAARYYQWSFCGAGDYAGFDADNAFRFFAIGRADADAFPDHEFASTSSGAKEGLEVVHPDGITGAARAAITNKGASTGGNEGNCGSAAADPSILGVTLFSAAELYIPSVSPLGTLRGVVWPMQRLDDIYTNAEEIEGSGLTLTLVKVFGTSAIDPLYLGSLPVDANGPW